MNKANNYCCDMMENAVSDPRVYLNYDERYKEYYICTKDPVIIYVIEYCPWCRVQLPKNLTDEWFNILEQEYALDDPDSKEQEKLIPAEFKTDEWWKKRNL